MKGKEIKEAFDEGYKTGVEAERARVRKMLDQCQKVYERESWEEREKARKKFGPFPGVGPLPSYFSELEKMLSDKATACEYAIFIVCEWSIGPDFKENWMPLRF
jgi:hypothetical protein